jgi:hypothetical protein
MCRAYSPVLENALSFRSQGIPISTAEGMADSAFKVDVNLYRFLIGAIREIYRSPETAERLIRSGNMHELCVQNVRGY